MLKQENSDIKKIIVHKFGGLGDYLCILPFLENLQRLYPNAEITAVISTGGKELLEKSGLVDHIIVAGKIGYFGWSSILSIAAFRDLWRMKKQIKAPYDLYIDLINKRSSLGIFKPFLTYLFARPQFSIGLDSNGLAFYLDKKIKEDEEEPKHCVEQYGGILKILDTEHILNNEYSWMPYPLTSIKITDDQHNIAVRYFSDFNSKKIKIGIHPGANLKRVAQQAWPIDHYAELADTLSDKISCEVFVTGSDQEQVLCDKLKNLLKCELHWIPQASSITELAAYISQLDFYITNNTGPMHLAVAMGVPTVGIFGDADYNLYGSYPDTVPFVAITRPKNKKPSSADPRNLADISVDEVYKAFLNLKSICR